MAVSTAYRDNGNLKKVGVSVQYTQEQVEEYVKCSRDPIYFSKYMKIITLDHGLVPYEMYDFQKDMIRTFNDNRFIISKLGRQSGKCICINSTIKLRNKSTGDIIETSIGDFYDSIKHSTDLSNDH